MTILSGQCVLIIDGQRFKGCSCALDNDDGLSGSLGFLSGPSEVLKRAWSAERVKIGIPDRLPLEITLLAINLGIVFFTFTEIRRIRVILTLNRWVAVVEGSDVRDVCIRAEEQLRYSGTVAGVAAYQVLNADGQQAAAITDYLNNVQLSMIDPHNMPISASIIHTLELAKLDGSIRRAEQLVCEQRQRVETLAPQGFPDGLAQRLLENLTTALALLKNHWHFIRENLMRGDRCPKD
jgi:hypothetical protein